ncbi:PREDICTED: C3a anaphylatoxin chemotactic receptor-like [Nanorana parkeri]|uniref:C3a anaphylatoxin chemotactic receptor-like n=1 Tax=Nanorana parkeri TaxID=125878 RepID=UPI00085449DF|nr:PREDICTED: C3a anaphylatoxin chemotactic receptor-like [Nanorana parkeri]
MPRLQCPIVLLGWSVLAMAELTEELCKLIWDIINNPEFEALNPSTDNPTAIQYVSYLLSILTCLAGLVGNAIVIAVTAFLMENSKSKIWFLNLAVADFTFILFLTFNTASVIQAHWPYGLFMCKCYHFFTFVNMYASIYILIALNIDRALSIAKPIWHMKFLSKKICYSVCALIWIIATLSSIPAFVYSNEYDHDHNIQCTLFSNDVGHFSYISSALNSTEVEEIRNIEREQCQGDMEDENIHHTWNNMFSSTTNLLISLLVIGYFIPLCIILITNLVIAIKVKNSQSGPSSRLYRVVIAAIMAFFCSRTPLVLGQIIFLASAYTLQFTLMYRVIVFLPLLSSIAAINSCLNPIIYVLIGKQSKAMRFVHSPAAHVTRGLI